MKYDDYCENCGNKIKYEGDKEFFRCPHCGEKHYTDSAKELFRLDEVSYYGEIADKNLKVNDAKVGDIVRFGDLFWKVLEKKDDKTLLILNNCIKVPDDTKKRIIDNGNYVLKQDSYNWVSSVIRNYLNNDFLEEQFDDESRARIIPTNMEIDVSDGKHPINDKVFLLDKTETEKYLKTPEERKSFRIFLDYAAEEYYLLRNDLYNAQEEIPDIVDEEGNIVKLEKEYVVEYFRPVLWVTKIRI